MVTFLILALLSGIAVLLTVEIADEYRFKQERLHDQSH